MTMARVDPGEVERPVGGLTCFLLGWTGAAPKHVEKYADAYRERFAGAAVVVVTDHCQIGVSTTTSSLRSCSSSALSLRHACESACPKASATDASGSAAAVARAQAARRG